VMEITIGRERGNKVTREQGSEETREQGSRGTGGDTSGLG